jgi:2-dehydro-3-deoxyglucarate aldolase/4-hydroxy-2-oxoheptanedioate aldolase
MIPGDVYLASADKAFLKIVQIEHIAAVRDIEAILGVEGLDAVIIGPNDLSASIGKLGKLKDPEVVALYDKIVGACKRAGKPCGVSIGPGDEGFIRDWIGRGVDFISCGDDISFLAAGALKTIDFIRRCPR